MGVQALVLLGVAILLGGLATFVYHVSLPYVGFEFGGGRTVGRVAASGPAAAAGLQVGDKVLTIDGRAPMLSGDIYLRPGQRTLHLVVRRGEQALSLNLVPAPPSAATILDSTGYFFMALGYWTIGMIVLAFKRRDQVGRLFVLLCLLGAAVIVVWPLADLGSLWANLSMTVLVAVIGPVFVHYHTLFPERTAFKGKRLLLAGLYASGLVLLVLSTALDVLYYTGRYQSFSIESWPTLAPAVKAYFALCLLIGLALLVRTYRVTQSETSRRQLALVVLGTGLALLGLTVLILIPQILVTGYIVPPWIPLLMLVLIPASYLYATYRHNLMNLDRAVNRTVVFTTLSLLLVVLYLGLDRGLRALIPDLAAAPILLLDAVSIVALVLALQPLRRRIQVLVDHAFYGGSYTYESFISDKSQALNNAQDMATVVEVLTEQVARTLRTKSIALLLPEGEDTFCVRARQGLEAAHTLCHNGALTATLKDLGQPIDHQVLCERLRSDPKSQADLAPWSRAGAALWVPLVQQQRLEGLLVLGSKIADEFYSREDRFILSTLAHQAAVAIARTRLVDQLQGQVHEIQSLSRALIALQDDRNRQLARELHDQAIQDLLFVHQLLEETRTEFVPEKIEGARDEVLRVSIFLRNVIFDLRPPVLDYPDLGSMLEQYAASFAKRYPQPAVAVTVRSDDNVTLPAKVSDALFRIFHESLTNARKHAQATRVDVSLVLEPTHVRLEIRDNGRGFAKPAYYGDWINQGKLGLVGMRERAAEVGGHLELDTRPGHGTRLAAVVSVPQPPSM